MFPIFASFVDAVPYNPATAPWLALAIFLLLGILSFVDNAKNRANKILADYAAKAGIDPNVGMVITIGWSPRPAAEPQETRPEPEHKPEPVSV